MPDFRGITPVGAGWNSLADMLEASGDQYHAFLGVYRQDQLQGHSHAYGSYSNASGAAGTTIPYAAGGQYNLPTLVSDTIHGTPRIGDYSTGPYVGINYEIKY